LASFFGFLPRGVGGEGNGGSGMLYLTLAVSRSEPRFFNVFFGGRRGGGWYFHTTHHPAPQSFKTAQNVLSKYYIFSTWFLNTTSELSFIHSFTFTRSLLPFPSVYNFSLVSHRIVEVGFLWLDRGRRKVELGKRGGM